MRDEFGKNMRITREGLGWSQGKLSRQMVDLGWAGFHQTTVARLESGSRPVKLYEAYAIAEILGTTIGYLAGKEDEPDRPKASPATLNALDQAIAELAAIRNELGETQ